MNSNICNRQLDCEYLASKYIKGLIYPTSYVTLRTELSSLKKIITYSIVDAMYDKIADLICDKEDKLNDMSVKDYWKGNNEQLFTLLNILLKQNSLAIEEMGYRMRDVFSRIEESLTKEMYLPGWGNKITAINRATEMNKEMAIHEQMGKDLQKNEYLLQNLLQQYGVGKDEELPTKGITPEYSDKYKSYALSLYRNMGDYLENMDVAIPLTRALSSAIGIYPQDGLDPFKIDLVDNLLDVLSDPDCYSKKVKSNKILGDSVVNAFRTAYPEYAMLSMEECSNMVENRTTYQKELTFNKDFGLGRGDSDLVQFCLAHK